MGAQHIIGESGYLAEVSPEGAFRAHPRDLSSIGSLYPGGLVQIVSISAHATTPVVTTLLPHRLTTGDSVFFATTNSNVVIDGTRVVTVTGTTTFTVPSLNTTGAAGNTGTVQPCILSSSVANPTVVTTGSAHGLRTGDTVTVTGSAGGTSLDGAAQVVTVISARTFSIPIDVSAGTTSTAQYTKVTYNTDVLDRGAATSGGAVVITTTDGSGTTTTKANIQGSVDNATWFNIPYSLVATPRTFVVTELTIATPVTTTYLLQELVFWRYMRVSCNTNTNMLVAVTATYI